MRLSRVPVLLLLILPRAALPADGALPNGAVAAWSPEPDSGLADRSGGVALIATAAADLDSSVSGNQVGDQVVTGGVSLSDSAVSNVRGIFVSTFNTGNNASIQTNLNVIVHLD